MCVTPWQKSSWSCKCKTRLQDVARNITAASLELPLGNLVALGTDAPAAGKAGGMVESSRFATLRIGGVEWRTTKPWIRHHIKVRILWYTVADLSPKKAYTVLHKHPAHSESLQVVFLLFPGSNNSFTLSSFVSVCQQTTETATRHQGLTRGEDWSSDTDLRKDISSEVSTSSCTWVIDADCMKWKCEVRFMWGIPVYRLCYQHSIFRCFQFLEELQRLKNYLKFCSSRRCQFSDAS